MLLSARSYIFWGKRRVYFSGTNEGAFEMRQPSHTTVTLQSSNDVAHKLRNTHNQSGGNTEMQTGTNMFLPVFRKQSLEMKSSQSQQITGQTERMKTRLHVDSVQCNVKQHNMHQLMRILFCRRWSD